jgi:hypothetical protein
MALEDKQSKDRLRDNFIFTIYLKSKLYCLYSLLYSAALEGNLIRVQYFLDLGANVNVGDEKGRTPVFGAARNGHVDVVSVLVSHGADLNKRNSRGATPLMVSVGNGHTSVVNFLIGKTVDVNEAMSGGETLLYVAAANGHLHVVHLLLARGARIDQEDVRGDNPARVAFRHGHMKVVELLNEAHVSIISARNGDWKYFRSEIVAGELKVPHQQWFRELPDSAKEKLCSWIHSSLMDFRACYATIFRPVASMETNGDILIRTKVVHDGIPSIRRLIISFLVYPNCRTRQLLYECESYEIVSTSFAHEWLSGWSLALRQWWTSLYR